ncbi:phenazine biosynthesis protein PhzC [Salinactinospora qingdaonensis]|uniref:Phospho-2-dehydro-3-deoxyheptonate aldolase n=2 Tax=Salinactinospora qingdaonensis TaxID=702744 RepID=A0ABP7EWR1_9ACTN
MLPAQQQPEWSDHPRISHVRDELSRLPGLVGFQAVLRLKTILAEVARGERLVIQAGDCAEDFADCGSEAIAAKSELLAGLAATMSAGSDMPVTPVGRIAGQFAKPRSRPTEHYDGIELPVYRGHMVNSPLPDPRSRRPDPNRLLLGHRAARHAAAAIEASAVAQEEVWTSHEALLLDYEIPMLRCSSDGRTFLASTHWPWVGNRTRQLDHAHVALLSSVANPVACKIGPTTAPSELLELCERLDPQREPGRLTLISRMGADLVGDRLPPLVEAVAEAGHPVVWLCDPMHGNTLSCPTGHKTRFVTAVIREANRFQDVLAARNAVAGGLHLETTPEPVTECVVDSDRLALVPERYTTHCDPRLNPEQALTVASVWRLAGAPSHHRRFLTVGTAEASTDR